MELNINELDYDLDNAFDEYPMNQNQNQILIQLQMCLILD